MRIPFDLIAAILCADRMGAYFEKIQATPPPFARCLWVWPLFLFASWLAHEIGARLTERRTRFGEAPDGGGVGMHPQQFHNRCILAAQLFSVALFACASWYLKWPVRVAHWPRWFHFDDSAKIGGLLLSDSAVLSTLLLIGPYLSAMVLSWIPRRRATSGPRGRLMPLREYLSFESKLTLLPLSLCIVFAVLGDLGQMLPKAWTHWFTSNDLLQTVSVLAVAGLAVTVFVPLAAIKMWHCEPLPEGELKTRMAKLLERSGVKARGILVWGSRASGMLNACVMGPWSRFRFVLISPALVDELSLDETEAVLGHELGHARYGHLTFYFVVVICMALLIDPISNASSHGWLALPVVQAGLTLAFVIGYIYFFFGALSRQCEREADLASAELIGTPAPLVAALEKLADRCGNTRAIPCWHHGSIAERVSEVLRLSGNPDESQRFHARLKILRIGLIVFTLILFAAQIVFHPQPI